MSGVFYSALNTVVQTHEHLLLDSTLPTVLKRKGSLSMDHNGSARKKNHTGVQSFVSTPAHEADLRLHYNTCLDDLRIAMELTKAQFAQLTVSVVHGSN
jgi:hypothetical protein